MRVAGEVVEHFAQPGETPSETRNSTMKREPIPLLKVGATAGGSALTGTAVWLNAEHIAASEGWFSPLVLAGVFVTLCAAATPPLAERAAKAGQPAKAAALWLFFALAVSFSLIASVTRSSGHRDAQVAAIQQNNIKTHLANEAYETAVANRVADCASGRGPRCRAAEAILTEARRALVKPDRYAALIPPSNGWRYCSASVKPRSRFTARWLYRWAWNWEDLCSLPLASVLGVRNRIRPSPNAPAEQLRPRSGAGSPDHLASLAKRWLTACRLG
jgi:hypothetical protein